MPSPDSAVVVDDFKTLKDLVEHITYLNTNDTAYSHYIRYKHEGVANDYLRKVFRQKMEPVLGYGGGIIDAQCGMCRQLHHPSGHGQAMHRNTSLRCPKPRRFSLKDSNALLSPEYDDWFTQEYVYRQYQFDAFLHFTQQGANWTYIDLYNYAVEKISVELPRFAKSGVLEGYKRFAEENEF